jgi:general secretion pathway protein D
VLKCVQILALAVLGAATCLAAEAAQRLFEAGERAARAGDSLRALLLFSQAAQLEPANALYAQKRAALQRSPLAKLDVAELPTAPPPRLEPDPGVKTFDLRTDPRALFEQVAGAYGIKVVFDGAYQAAAPSIRFRIAEAAGTEALRAVSAATDSFLVPVTEHVALVARDSTQKRAELTPAMAVAVPIPERLSVQEAQEIVTAVQQMLELRRISLDAAKRVVYFRDSAPKAIAARQIFTNLSRGRAQVEVEVEFISVARNSSLHYGLSLPTSSSLVNFGNTLGNTVRNTGSAYYALGGGASLLGLGIADAAAFATLTKNSSDTVLRSEITAADGQLASLHVGNRYPVLSASFSGVSGAPAPNAGQFSTVQFVDLGLLLKVTPVVHENQEVTLDVDAEFKTLGSRSANGIPEIASRQYQGKVRLTNGQWAVIAGLLSASDAQTTSGLPGLTSVPGLSNRSRDRDVSETWIVLKPRLVSLPPWERPTPPMWTGTETRPLTGF